MTSPSFVPLELSLLSAELLGLELVSFVPVGEGRTEVGEPDTTSLEIEETWRELGLLGHRRKMIPASLDKIENGHDGRGGGTMRR